MRSMALLAALAAGAMALAGCDSFDATAKTFPVMFENDIGRNVNLKLCSDSSCHTFDYSAGMATGQSAQENISDRRVLTRLLVQDGATGRTLGCLPLELDQKYQHVIVRISQMVRCPGSAPLVIRDKGKGLGRS